MVTTYKAPVGGVISDGNKRFNDIISSPRVISEHVNGILKGRWLWLKSIPNLLTENRLSMTKIMTYIDCCVILHNFLIEESLNNDEHLLDVDDDDSSSDEDNDADSYYDGDEYNERRNIAGEERPFRPRYPGELPPDDDMNQPLPPGARLGERRERLRAYLSEAGLLL